MAKANGVILLTLPPHTSHKLQPMDRAIYKPLKRYYYGSAEQNYPGHLTPQPENVTPEHSPRDVNDQDMVARVGKFIITPSMIQPFPKSSSNNSTKGKRKRKPTTILTNTPIMKQMEIEEYDERIKKMKNVKKNFSPIVLTRKKEEKAGENTNRDN
ncbi:hypothetical protein HHI36_014029 [Cryptolaemus montrouzieri]|uniref:DDE-1 domain-containing protein n=1 Tax=Cryptolaemus montrouzieri TaxID=559131 RepID=A0ABD2N1W3_9CUCU